MLLFCKLVVYDSYMGECIFSAGFSCQTYQRLILSWYNRKHLNWTLFILHFLKKTGFTDYVNISLWQGRWWEGINDVGGSRRNQRTFCRLLYLFTYNLNRRSGTQRWTPSALSTALLRLPKIYIKGRSFCEIKTCKEGLDWWLLNKKRWLL